jgi:hypothetical protein
MESLRSIPIKDVACGLGHTLALSVTGQVIISLTSSLFL